MKETDVAKSDSRRPASVDEKRAALLTSERKLEVGRRESPAAKPEAKRNWKAIVIGLISAVVIVILVVAMFIIIGKDASMSL